jgi:hypothetical protein
MAWGKMMQAIKRKTTLSGQSHEQCAGQASKKEQGQ